MCFVKFDVFIIAVGFFRPPFTFQTIEQWQKRKYNHIKVVHCVLQVRINLYVLILLFISFVKTKLTKLLFHHFLVLWAHRIRAYSKKKIIQKVFHKQNGIMFIAFHFSFIDKSLMNTSVKWRECDTSVVFKILMQNHFTARDKENLNWSTMQKRKKTWKIMHNICRSNGFKKSVSRFVSLYCDNQ